MCHRAWVLSLLLATVLSLSSLRPSSMTSVCPQPLKARLAISPSVFRMAESSGQSSPQTRATTAPTSAVLKALF
eukprot:9542077-Lingulodinium_polyedra.AAC.1